MEDEIQGALIAAVLDTGVSPDGQGYVECEFSDGVRGALAFEPDMAASVVVAFMDAAAQAQRAGNVAPGQVDVLGHGYRVDRVELGFQSAPNSGTQDRLLLSLIMPTGASLNFGLSENTARQLAALLPKGLQAFRRKPLAN